MKIGSLFAGIGGFDLAAKWAGLETAWYSEIDLYACAVMRKHFPGVPNLGDITKIETAPPVDILCGGFPCQDISFAGKGAGIEGERSGLWAHYARLIAKIAPSYILIENVSALRSRGLERVLRDLLALGYDAEWHCVPAAYVGAPHRRDRIWIVATRRPLADTRSGRCGGTGAGKVQQPGRTEIIRTGEDVADSASKPEPEPGHEAKAERSQRDSRLVVSGSGSRQYGAGAGSSVADANGDAGHEGRESYTEEVEGGRNADRSCVSANATADSASERRGEAGELRRDEPEEWTTSSRSCHWWDAEPNVGRVAHGIPSRVDRLRCLGNAIVPQVAFPFFQAIVLHDLIYGQELETMK